MELLHAPAGLTALVALSWVLSEQRSAVRWRLVIAGLVLQALLAALLLLVPWLRAALFSLDGAMQALDRATGAGASFVFGYLGGGPAPFEVRPSDDPAQPADDVIRDVTLPDAASWAGEH